MSTKERMLRAAGLIIILRDELEELNQHHDWLEIANKYLDVLTNYEDGSNEQYEKVFLHVHNCIEKEGSPDELINELIFILEKDLKVLEMTKPVAKKLYDETLRIKTTANIKKVKLLDSKIRLV